jgi:hypothetical protein
MGIMAASRHSNRTSAPENLQKASSEGKAQEIAIYMFLIYGNPEDPRIRRVGAKG